MKITIGWEWFDEEMTTEEKKAIEEGRLAAVVREDGDDWITEDEQIIRVIRGDGIDDLFDAMNTFGPAQTFLEEGNFHKLYRDRLGRSDVPAPGGIARFSL